MPAAMKRSGANQGGDAALIGIAPRPGATHREGQQMSSTATTSPRTGGATRGAPCGFPRLLVTRRAEEDFEGLIPEKRRKVLRALERPIQGPRSRKLVAQGDARLWRVRVGDLRIIINARDEGEYIWRIADRKAVYRLVGNLDPRSALCGDELESFLGRARARARA
jgi:mRNA-degrading endonuclease RelE of RelBE toxin-antitoxin system